MNMTRSLLTILGTCLIFGHTANAADPAPAPVNGTAQAPKPPDNEAALIERGKYVAHLGDCVACHTAIKGQAMAGGLELKTPMGTIYSTNITPDVTSGIGNYSFAQFDRAMRKGVAADGHNLITSRISS